MLRYLPTAMALAAVGAAAWWLVGVLDDRAALQQENASLARSVAVLEREKENARLAEDVARAEAERQRKKATEYDALKEALLRGDEDAPLPQWFRDYFDDLLGGLR